LTATNNLTKKKATGRKKKDPVTDVFADLFCGAGGTTTGAMAALDKMGRKYRFVAVNHWDVAIETHSLNHPEADHACQSIASIHPEDLVPGGRLKILFASPECTDHSNAKGGKPRDIEEPTNTITSTSRGVGLVDPYLVNLKATERRMRDINEPTFTQMAGSNHQALVQPEAYTISIERARTNRSVARPVDEPIATVTGTPRIGLVETDAFTISAGGPELPPKTVDEPLRTVLTRDHQGVVETEAFVIGQQSAAAPREVGEPIPTIAQAGAIALVEPEAFLFNMAHTGKDADEKRHESYCKTPDEPLPTVAGKGMFALIEPYLVQFFGERAGQTPRTRSVDDPAWTVTTHGRMGVAEPEVIGEIDEQKGEPFIVTSAYGHWPGENDEERRTASIDDPLKTITGSPTFGVAEPYIVPCAYGKKDENGDERSYPIDDPLKTITGSNNFAVAEPFVTNMKGQASDRSVEDPLFTQTTKESQALVEPYIIRFHGQMGDRDINEPLGTLTTKERFGLVIPQIGVVIDIRFRMLQPHELSAAMSFPEGYQFAGNREAKVKQIGNAVPVRLAEALCRAVLS
jgi:DNA (cytosine-5)-methyltransferase 1